MMAYRVNASIPTAKTLISEGSSSCSQRGPDAPGYQTYRTFGMGAGGGRATFRQNQMKFPVMQPLSSYRDGKTLLSGFVVGGTPNLPEDNKLESENIIQETDNCGRHFLFDKSCVRLERTRTAIPPLPRDYPVHRLADLHPFNLSKELSRSHAGQPFTLGYPRRYEVNTSPAILFPTTLVLNGRNAFTVANSKLSRPKVNYPTYHPMTVKDNQKSQSYQDPMIGAPRSFIHRISELSSLEGETVRQENLKKMRKSRKPPS
ncbi:uncharacterized protein si:ch211-171b20.3 [Melanotaenia boesemani]|uniref:uncharacterized protein si:ch211-171b20.3 n=1 Tax=Melanotaenia boesemani TaxID=1250792 RepID=UPI001C051C49|nr:uncharacterized protein si:ch211-171b20.3 [Melanotaenia boesemani]